MALHLQTVTVTRMYSILNKKHKTQINQLWVK